MIYFFQKRILSIKNAIRGLFYVLKNETHAKIHFLALIIVSAMGFFWDISLTEWALLFLTFGLVLSLEIINTSIEKMADFIHPKENEQIGQIKDIAAGAVLVATMTSVLVGLVIFLPKLTIYIK